MRTLARLTLAASLTTLGGCQSLLNSRYADSVPPTRGIENTAGPRGTSSPTVW